MIVGAGSALFEMIRHLVERQPLSICPLVLHPGAAHRHVRRAGLPGRCPKSPRRAPAGFVEIGGAAAGYADMLTGYAQARKLRRWRIPALVSPRALSSYWVAVGHPNVHWRPGAAADQGCTLRACVQDDLARQLFPHIQPLDYPAAVHLPST